MWSVDSVLFMCIASISIGFEYLVNIGKKSLTGPGLEPETSGLPDRCSEYHQCLTPVEVFVLSSDHTESVGIEHPSVCGAASNHYHVL